MSDSAPRVGPHRIFESESDGGNMGAQYKVWRGFCSCGWASDRTSDRAKYERVVRDHLSGAA